MTWAERVKERDGNKCVICGKTDWLEANHVKPTFLYPENKNDIENGITVCKGCHQRMHNGNFAGYKLHGINGLDPDPEKRMQEYIKKRREEQERRQKENVGLNIVWSSNKENGLLLLEASKAAGIPSRLYIAEAISMRLASEGLVHDQSIFIKEWERETYFKDKDQRTT